MNELIYDDSPWTAEEKASLAAAVFGKDDDTDYSDYLLNAPEVSSSNEPSRQF